MIYVRHAAWLHAVPGKSKEPRIKSRPDPAMPPLEWGEHLIAYLFECGPVMSTGMGVAPICDRDLMAWCSTRGVALTPWEFDMIVKMSRAYSNGLTQYADTAALPPWTPPVDEVKAKQATDAFASWAKRMASR